MQPARRERRKLGFDLRDALDGVAQRRKVAPARRAVGGLNLVHYRALVIGLKNLGLYARLAAYAMYVFN